MNVYAALNLADENVNPMAKVSNLGVLLNVVIPLLTAGAGLVFFIMLIVGAFGYLTSGGNPESTKKAQGTLTGAVIGLILVLCAYLIIKLISYFFKVEIPI